MKRRLGYFTFIYFGAAFEKMIENLILATVTSFKFLIEKKRNNKSAKPVKRPGDK